MKKPQKFRSCFLTVIWLAIAIPCQIYSQLSQTLSFDIQTLTVEEKIAEDNKTYQHIKIGDLPVTGEPGKPALPVKVVKLLIPSNEEVSTITIEVLETIVLPGNYPVFPMQHDIPISDRYETPEFTTPDSAIYYGTTPYPEMHVRLIHDGYLDGSNHVVTVGIQPVQFDPLTKDLILAESISFTLEFQPSAKQPLNVQSRKSSLQEIYNTVLNDMITNNQDIPQYGVTPLSLTEDMGLPNTRTELPAYDYVVITSNALKPAFDEFISWKTRKGYNIGIVTTEEIYFEYPDGDIISGIDDDAGSIRQYLSEAYVQGTVWVLLGGDFSVVPVRYGDKANNSCPYDEWSYIVSDLYFADFNGDWDVDGIEDCNDDPPVNRYGEKDDDDPDYNPEIFIGRLPCTNEQDIYNWIEKVLGYEQNPGGGDPSYLTNGYWFQGAGLSSNPNTVKNHYPISFTHDVWDNSTYHDGSEVISQMSNTPYGLIHWYAHGAPNSVRTKPESQQYKRFFTHDDECTWGYCSEEEGDGLDDLTNYPNYAINYSISCDIANPDRIIVPNSIKGFDGAYYPAFSIEHGKGYWVLANGTGTITITNEAQTSGGFVNLMEDANYIKFTNATGKEKEVYFGVDVPEEDQLSYTLPPLPPDEVMEENFLDARYTNNYTYTEATGTIEVRNTDYPLTVEYGILNDDGEWEISSNAPKRRRGDEEYGDIGRVKLSRTGTIVVEHPIESFTIRKTSVNNLPTEFALSQNYPNPFNPITTIMYDVPKESHVTLTVYDLMGRVVRELVSGKINAGTHSII